MDVMQRGFSVDFLRIYEKCWEKMVVQTSRVLSRVVNYNGRKRSPLTTWFRKPSYTVIVPRAKVSNECVLVLPALTCVRCFAIRSVHSITDVFHCFILTNKTFFTGAMCELVFPKHSRERNVKSESFSFFIFTHCVECRTHYFTFVVLTEFN